MSPKEVLLASLASFHEKASSVNCSGARYRGRLWRLVALPDQAHSLASIRTLVGSPRGDPVHAGVRRVGRCNLGVGLEGPDAKRSHPDLANGSFVKCYELGEEAPSARACLVSPWTSLVVLVRLQVRLWETRPSVRRAFLRVFHDRAWCSSSRSSCCRSSAARRPLRSSRGGAGARRSCGRRRSRRASSPSFPLELRSRDRTGEGRSPRRAS